jgi:GNAT superfamily N-acetyltransferase
MYAAAPTTAITTFGLQSALFGNVSALAGPGLPISEFNRAFCLDEAVSPSLESISSWLSEQASPDFALQIAAVDSAEELRRNAVWLGFKASGNGWCKLVCDLAHPPSDSPAPAGVTVRPDRDGGLYGDLVVRAFGLPEVSRDWFGALSGRAGWTLFVAEIEGKPVGSAALFIRSNWAWFGIDGTLEEAHRQGVQSALIQARLKAARAANVLYATAETDRPDTADGRHTSRDNYLRNGFVEAYVRSNFKRIA